MGTDIHMSIETQPDKGTWSAIDVDIDVWRNYVLFAVLGDVRNGYGVAGMDTGDRIEPCVGAMRGLPESTDLQTGYLGDHSFGWATVEELLAYDWKRTIVKRGVITEAAYLEDSWRNGGPEGWSAAITGPDIVTFPEKDYEDRRKNASLPEDWQIYVKVEWYPVLADCVLTFLDRLNEINDLVPLPPDRIRLVYGFDS